MIHICLGSNSAPAPVVAPVAPPAPEPIPEAVMPVGSVSMEQAGTQNSGSSTSSTSEGTLQAQERNDTQKKKPKVGLSAYKTPGLNIPGDDESGLNVLG